MIEESWDRVKLSEEDNVPCARYGHAAVLVEDVMLVFGGADRFPKV